MNTTAQSYAELMKNVANIAINNNNMTTKIRLIRRMKEMTQAELALKSGISSRMIAAYEANENDITLGKLHAIAQALEVKVSDLIIES